MKYDDQTSGIDEPKKRRGPLLWLAGRSWRFWIGGAVITPVLYGASVPPVIGYAPTWTFAFVLPYAEPYYWLIRTLPSPLSETLNDYYDWWIVPPT